MTRWLLDTLLFHHLAAGPGPRETRFRDWVSRNGEDIVLSAISIFEIKAKIEKLSPAHRQTALAWLKVIIARHNDRIYPVDAKVAMCAGAFKSQPSAGVGWRLFDPLLAATAEVHGHRLLTARTDVFSAWRLKIRLFDPFQMPSEPAE